MSDQPVKHLVSQDFLLNQLQNAILHPLAADPGTPGDFQIWSNTTDNRIKMNLPGGVQSLAWLSDVTAGGLTAGLFDANTLLKADSDDTPVALTVAESGIVGRAAGGTIASLTAAQVIAILGLPAGAVASEAFVNTAIAALADSAPAALDTLNELAAALGDDPNFAATITTQLAARNQNYSGLIGDGSATIFQVTHGFTRHVVAAMYEAVTGDRAIAGESMGAVGSTTYNFFFSQAPAVDAYRVVITGTP